MACTAAANAFPADPAWTSLSSSSTSTMRSSSCKARSKKCGRSSRSAESSLEYFFVALFEELRSRNRLVAFLPAREDQKPERPGNEEQQAEGERHHARRRAAIEGVTCPVAGYRRSKRHERQFGGEDAAAELIRHFQLQQNGAEDPENRSAEMREQHAQCCERQNWSAGKRGVEDADHEICRSDRSPEHSGFLAEDPAEHDGAERGAHAACAVQNTDARGAIVADREYALAKNGEEQEDARARPPTRLHQHERRHTRVSPDVASPVHEIANPRQFDEPAQRLPGGWPRIVARRRDEQR